MARTNPAEFMETMLDLTVLFKQLNPQDRTFIQNIYKKMVGNPQVDPNVTKAEHWLKDAAGNTLVELGVDRLQRGRNDEDYYNFRGGILTALEEWQGANPGKKIDRETFMKDVAPNILKWKPQTWTNWLT